MKGQDGGAPAWVQATRKAAQKRVEGRELVVHGDAQGLEDAADGKLAAVVARVRQRVADGRRQFGGADKAPASQSVSEGAGIRFVCILDEQRVQGIGPHFFEQTRGGLAPVRIHAHVERAFMFHGEAARRIV